MKRWLQRNSHAGTAPLPRRATFGSALEYSRFSTQAWQYIVALDWRLRPNQTP